MPQIIALRDPTIELTGGDRILTTPSTIHLEPCPHHYLPVPTQSYHNPR
ncbi:MAG: hypothetical protein V7K62_31750 [Nostoc sp.]